MTLSPGTRLGPYEVTAEIGAGGMGIVYRAHDTKLGRDVALKVLPDLFADDPERLARFQREAKVLASLNHPNIAQIHGFEESGDTQALVLELVEGPTLADRIAQGAIPIHEALPIAKQIAEALEAAHEAGVIHRDLKPANIKVREDGTVKVLDFGLAKALGPEATGDPSQSPTLSAAPTRQGVIMGTAGYMSPEQARGKPVDKRADIWAFGAVVYEMLAGQRAFRGEEVSDILASVLAREPDAAALPANVPPALLKLLRRCLEKDPRRRLRDVGDLLVELDEASSAPPPEPTTTVVVAPQPGGWRRVAPLVAAAVAAGFIVGVAVWSLTRPAAPASPPTRRLAITLPATDQLINANGLVLALSPDGSTLVYAGRRENSDQLYRRSLDQLDPVPIPGTESARELFFSPDGEWIAFTSEGALKKVALRGGPPVTICDCVPRGVSWAPDDTIVFGAAGSGISRVSAAGGEPHLITTLEEGEIEHRLPELLPGGQAVLFTVSGATPEGHIAVQSLETGERRVLVDGTNPRFVSTGHLVFARAGALWAAPFDLDRLDLTAEPVPILEGVRMVPTAGAQFSFASDGSFVYIPGVVGGLLEGMLVWVNRDGREVEPIADAPLEFPRYLRLSPDGRRLALTIGPGNEGDLWVYDLEGRPPTPLTFEGHNEVPVWMPDGTRVAFTSTRAGPRNLFSIAADGSTLNPEPLLTSPNDQRPYSWSPDGGDLIFWEQRPETGNDILALPIEGEGEPRVVVGTEYNERLPALSPDGRWLAYVSNVTGQPEIWVLPYPGAGAPMRISPNGGTEPVWSRDGRELFYLEGNKMMAVALETEPGFRFDPAEELFDEPYTHRNPPSYDVAPDGRFVMIQPGDPEPQDAAAASHMVVVLNWFEELQRLVPVN